VTDPLELGGKSPNIWFADADADADAASAATGSAAGIFAAGGQTCVVGSRVFVHGDECEETVERVTQRAHTIRIGNPL
jgi:acyl-CoA reductase-like NAD-dependent aldehyde dehydrogenase